jgi:PAS domain S-box-containing protein
MKNVIGNFPNLSFILALGIMLIVGVFAVVNLRAFITHNRMVSHTLIVLNKLDETRGLLTDAETGQRGYVITGEERYLESYNLALAPVDGIEQHLEDLRQLTIDNFSQQERLKTLNLLVDEKLAFMAENIDLRRNVGFGAARNFVLTDKGKQTMDDIRQWIAEMEQEENEILRQRSEAASVSLQNTLVMFTAGAVLSFSLLINSFYTVKREITEKQRAEKALIQLNMELDEKVQQRAAELTRANERYHRTLDYMLEGCQIIDFDWRYLYVNETVARQGRQTREELLGHTMLEIYPGIENTPLFAELRECMRERKPTHMENEFTYPTGDKGWFELSIEPVPEGLFILSMDITERKQAEMDLERQLNRLKSLRMIDLAILGATNLQLMLKTVLDETEKRLQADVIQVMLLNSNIGILENAAVSGNQHINLEQFTIRPEEGICGRVTLGRQTVALRSVNEADPSDALISEIRKENAQSVYLTPLIAKGKLVGTLNVIFRKPFQASQDWLDFFETLAGQTAMAVDSSRSFEALRRSNLMLALAYDSTIEGWSRALDLRDHETEGHTLRVTEMTLKIARTAGMADAELVHVRRGALLHDIGKMGIPDAILLKPSKLEDEEWIIMRMHPIYAYELLLPIDYLQPSLDIPYCHHEKWDGTGYPRGLRGEQIPLAARLFAVVDVWDALRSDRPYRLGWPEVKVREYIESLAGSHFDPQAVELFFRAS